MSARRYCFTLNNPTQGESDLIAQLLADADRCKYGIVGRETGESGTPHLQGFVIFSNVQRFNAAKRLISPRAHLEPARGTSAQAAEYCKKDGDFDEYGTLSEQGKRNDFEVFRDWITEQESRPREADIIRSFPSLYGRYRVSCMRMVELLWRPPPVHEGDPRDWQQQLQQQLGNEPNDRQIQFVVDPDGGKGKSWFIRWYCRMNPNDVQRLRCGKRDDMAHVLDPTKRVYLIDVPRGKLEFFSYALVEEMKDGYVFSGKYDSCMKEWDHAVHVVVFTNEEPDMTKLTTDRYLITYI